MIPARAAVFVSPDGEVHWNPDLARQDHPTLARSILARLEPDKAKAHDGAVLEALMGRGWARARPSAGCCSYALPLTDAQKRTVEELFRRWGPPKVTYEHTPTGRYAQAYTWEPKRWEWRCPTCDGKLRPNLDGRDFYDDTCNRAVALREAVMLVVPHDAAA